jgi:hypothetical protein
VKIFLKIKAWQLFILVFLPMLAPMFLSPMSSNHEVAFGVTTFIWMLVLVGWMYSVGAEANQRLPETLRKNMAIYRLGYGVTIFYCLLLLFVGFPPTEQSVDGQVTMPAWFVPLHLASMFGMFYGLWFTAKQFMTHQKGESVSFFEYSGPFFLFWFAPIGVWFLQPKINRAFNNGA